MNTRPIINFKLFKELPHQLIKDHCPNDVTLRIPGGARSVRTDIDQLSNLLEHILLLQHLDTVNKVDYILSLSFNETVEQNVAIVQTTRERGLHVTHLMAHNEWWLPRYSKTYVQALEHNKDKFFLSEEFQQVTPESYIKECFKRILVFENNLDYRYDYIIPIPFPNPTNSDGQLLRLREYTDRFLNAFNVFCPNNFQKRISFGVHPYVTDDLVDFGYLYSYLEQHGLSHIPLHITEHGIEEQDAVRMFNAGQGSRVYSMQAQLYSNSAHAIRSIDRWGMHILYQKEGWGLISKDGPTPLMANLQQVVIPILHSRHDPDVIEKPVHNDVEDDANDTIDLGQHIHVQYLGQKWVRIGLLRWKRRHRYEVIFQGMMSTHHLDTQLPIPEAMIHFYNILS
jgi:hypothetical protein